MKKLIGLAFLPLLLLSGCTEICNQGARCSLQPEVGPCDAAFIRYYYDQEDGICKEFVWGGCEGVVPFETLEECQEECECFE